MSSRRNRLTTIVQTLQVQNVVTVRELAEKLSVSEMTIRRDLSLLSQDNIVKLVHSGAVLNPDSLGASRYSLAEAGAQRGEVKMSIGRKAASLVEEGDIIIIDGGSTTECLAKSIPDTLQLTVLCWAMRAGGTLWPMAGRLPGRRPAPSGPVSPAGCRRWDRW